MVSNAMRTAVSGLAVSVFAAAAAGQWSADPASPLLIGDGASDQALPHIAGRTDGGCYVCWNDNRPGGYSAYLQRLDPSGHDVWAHNGVLLASGAETTTSDYSLIVDQSDNAVLAYQDDGNVQGATSQISVSKVAPDGTVLWRTTATTGATARLSPVITRLSDGTFVVAYSNGSSPFSWGMQKLDAGGNILWPAAGIDVTEAGHYELLSDVKSVGSGFAVLWVRGSGTNAITSSKGLYTQLYDGAGVPQWNSGSPVIVFAGNSSASIANGYFPTFHPDQAGGAVYGWYETSGQRNAYIQHVLANGSLKFASPVSNANTTTARMRIGAGLAYNAATGEYYLASPESDSSPQGNWTVFVQKFDSTGTRLWGDTGVHLIGPDNATPVPPQASFVQCQVMGGGVMTAWNWGGGQAVAGSTYAALTVGGGAPTTLWNQNVATQNIVQTRLRTATTPSGSGLLTFGYGPFGSMDIAGVRVNADGTLGNPPCYANCDNSTQSPVLNVADFTCFLQRYAANDSYANCDASTQTPTLNVADFTCFLQKYAQGCP